MARACARGAGFALTTVLAPALAAVLAAGPAGAQTTLYTFGGTQPLGQFGASVTAVGDIDLDGVQDVAVGDPLDPIVGPDAGAVHLFSGASGAALFTIFANSAGDRFGGAIATVGDLGIDGQPELVIGAVEDAGTGSVRLVDGVSGIELAHWLGSTTGGQLGTSVAGLGDVDGDGTPDFAMGAPRASWLGQSQAGRVRVVSGATLADAFTIGGLAAGEELGQALAAVGDIDGDGLADLVASGPGGDVVRAFSGASGALLWSVSGTPGSRFGQALAVLGDASGDGVWDLAIGAPLLGAGSVRIVSGADGSTHWTQSGQAAGDEYGSAVAGPGDVDGDGLGDVIVGAPGAAAQSGYAIVHSGATGQVFWVSAGAQPGDRFGQSVGGAGDVNADGQADILVGATGLAGQAPASGAACLLLSGCPVPRVFCSSPNDSLGCVSDVTFDGAPSLSVGDNFRIWARNVRSGAAGILAWGLAQSSQPLGGKICVANPSLMLQPLFSSGATPGQIDCTGVFGVNLGISQLASMGWTPGTEVYTQLWYRDGASTSGFATADGLKFTVCP